MRPPGGASHLACRAVLCALAGVLVMLTACNGNVDPTGPTDIGAGVVATGLGVGDLVARKVDGGPTTIEGLAVLAPVIEITTDRPPPEEVTLRLPLIDTLRPEEEPVVVVSSSLEGPWEAVPTKAQGADDYVIATVKHFSFFTTLRVSLEDLLAEARQIFDEATGGFAAEANQPQCDGEDEVRRSWSVTSSSGPVVKWCLGEEGGFPVLRVANGARYPLSASHAGLERATQHIDLKELGWLSRVGSGDRTVLMPRSEATFRLIGSSGSFLTELDGVAQSLFQLQVGAETALSILSRFGAGGPSERVDTLAVLYGSSKCAAAVDSPSGGSVIANCFSPSQMMEAFGWRGVLIAPLMVSGPLIEFFRSSFNALGDIVQGNDRYRISIDSASLPEVDPAAAISTLLLRAGTEYIAPECMDVWVFDLDAMAGSADVYEAYDADQCGGDPYAIYREIREHRLVNEVFYCECNDSVDNSEQLLRLVSAQDGAEAFRLNLVSSPDGWTILAVERTTFSF